MAITAAMVKELREKSGAGMMDCKKALTACEGNMEKAIDFLRENGKMKAAKKADRIAADGLVDTITVGDITAIIEVNTETDFVAKNESFREFVRGLLTTIVEKKPADVAALSECQYADTDLTVNAKLNEMVFTIGEKLDIRRFDIINGTTSTYIHGAGSIGLLGGVLVSAAGGNVGAVGQLVQPQAGNIAGGSCIGGGIGTKLGGGQGGVVVNTTGRLGGVQDKATVGCGDSMVAGFMYASEQGMTGRDKLIYATACGSATAFKLGLADKQEVEDLFNSYGKQ